MAKYKLNLSSLPYVGGEQEYSILNTELNYVIPIDEANTDYQRFVDDIYEQGTEIVEGADYVGVTTYTDARAAEYPPIVDQLDKIYHEGIDAWKADIKAIKDKYPKTQVGITSIAPIPDWVNTALFKKQKEEYIKAKARLEQYELSAGLTDEEGKHIIMPIAIEINGERNPLVVADELERTEAQEVINNTPQAVIESVSS